MSETFRSPIKHAFNAEYLCRDANIPASTKTHDLGRKELILQRTYWEFFERQTITAELGNSTSIYGTKCFVRGNTSWFMQDGSHPRQTAEVFHFLFDLWMTV